MLTKYDDNYVNKKFLIQINIAGYMHFWGLTIDTVTTIQLILAIGLSVDYSAHIGHGFMASWTGNRVGKEISIVNFASICFFLI